MASLFAEVGIDLSAALDEEAAGEPNALATRARAAGHHVGEHDDFEQASGRNTAPPSAWHTRDGS